MAEILLRAGECRDAAGDVKREAAAAQDQIEALRGRLQSMSEYFRGQTAQAFDETYNEWHEGAGQMLEGLDGLGVFLEGAANAIEETDSSIAAQLRG